MTPEQATRLRSPSSEYQDAVRYHLTYSIGATMETATSEQLFQALSLAVREQVMDRAAETERRYQEAGAKRLYYLSMEFLMGRSLGNNLINMGLYDIYENTLVEMGIDLEEVRHAERDAALGNGGLGRLAACFLDSLASLGMPGYGYGINYEFGLFRQKFVAGHQHEMPDAWSRSKSPWLLERNQDRMIVPLYGRLVPQTDRRGREYLMWSDWQTLIGVPSDMPVVGYGGRTVNHLRLFTAHASDEFDMRDFNDGDYIGAVEHKIASENVSKVLYPSDSSSAGKELRLVQEYFLVACSVRDIVRRFLRLERPLTELPDHVAIQLNDTHPALAVPELMRVLVDEKDLTWDRAWEVTRATLGYTNHTLLPEALERWPVALLERVLPRHMQIIFEINHRFLEEVRAHWPEPGVEAQVERLSIIEEGDEKQVRMANLAIVGSHSVNGVARLHTELVTTRLVPGFHALYPDRFNNKTNGVTQRRWMVKANPALAALLRDAIGDRWITDLDALRALEPFAEDADFRERFMAVKQQNKRHLARLIRDRTGVTVVSNSLFDVQAKRIHEYKRQLLFAMYMIHAYLDLLNGKLPAAKRTFLVAGKAAPAYARAKLIIRLINGIAHVVNRDERVGNHLSVVFLPDYRVSLAEGMIPAADLSEQISTAGMEASGTGNMKFAMNGALTIGTLDGANIEIREHVGRENIFIFGRTADEVEAERRGGRRDPAARCAEYAPLARVVDAMANDRFCQDEPGIFEPLVRSLIDEGDPYFLTADFQSYVETQAAVAELYGDADTWARRAILNVARMGYFSSDRTVAEYAAEIWGIQRY